jgi:hypothetical protein
MTDQLQEEPKPPQAEEKKPALTVVIQSWWTPALSVLALVVGLLLGYFGRPMLNKDSQAAAVTSPETTAAANLPTLPTPTVDQTAVINSQQELMDYLVSNTTHFKGDPNAPVTIIEFSDYQ